MTARCPCCQSSRVMTKDYARKACCTIGVIAGAAGGAAGAASGAEIGATAGLIAGPFGALFGGITGAIVGALVGGAIGGGSGAAFGEIIDVKILDNFVCQNCDYRFGATDSEGIDQPFHGL